MEIDTGTTELLCSVRDGVALITLNRPEARNALSDHLTPALRIQIAERGQDPDVGAILITGAGTAFCSGGDVKGMGQSGPRSPEQRRAAMTRYVAAHPKDGLGVHAYDLAEFGLDHAHLAAQFAGYVDRYDVPEELPTR